MKSRVLAVPCVLAACLVFAAPAWATKYVSLGDSYSSGTGTRTYYDGRCQRSVHSYPYLLHDAHPSWTFVHAACAGATTGDILNSQISSVTRDTDWVTYTIGGNDAGFSSVITACAEPSWLADCDSAVNDARSYIQNTLPGRLDLVNDAIRSHAPNARVIVLDYPRLFDGHDCNSGTFFSSSEEARLNQAGDILKSVLSEAAARAGSDFLFRDVIPPFIGHAVCDGGGGSSTEWINGLSNPVGESYHPKVTGQTNGYYPVVHATTG
jgi:lysophospholipase L1-like esterase